MCIRKVVGDRLGGEPVAYASDGVNVAGVLRVVFEFLAEPGDVYIDGAGGHARLILPHGLQKFVARNYIAAAIDQVAQEIELLGSEV
jgi:hypothetical protein